MEAHAQVGAGCRIPADTLMDNPAVYQPCHTVRLPVDGVQMEVRGWSLEDIGPEGKGLVDKRREPNLRELSGE
jgi:hypothetical protein